MAGYYLRFPGGKSKALTFSYDDGVEQDMRLVEIFRKHNMKATFNICSGLLSPEGTVHPKDKIHRIMTESQVLATYTEDVCEVAVHTAHHPFLTHQDCAVASVEITDDRKALEKMFQRQVHGMAYPQGAVNDTIVDICRYSGIYYARTTVSTEKFDIPNDWLRLPATCHHKNPRLMELADNFLELKPKNIPKMFYVWGHSYEFEQKDNWDVIEKFTEKMANKDDIWYATNMEIYLAWRNFQRLEFSADGNSVHNPSVHSVWVMNRNNEVREILPGQTVTF